MLENIFRDPMAGILYLRMLGKLASLNQAAPIAPKPAECPQQMPKWADHASATNRIGGAVMGHRLNRPESIQMHRKLEYDT
jgi:hypothetical protein